MYAVTGSCVALVLHDSKNRIAGLLHVVLPDGENHANPRVETFYAESGVDVFVRKMIGNGAEKTHMSAMIAGGGSLVNEGSAPIGKRNATIVKQRLEGLGIPIVEQDVGGNCSRRIVFPGPSGKILIQPIMPESGNGKREFTLPAEEIRSVSRHIAEIKPNPHFAGLLLKAIHREPVDWAAVKGIVSRDIVAALHVFRLANSAYYGEPGTVSSFESGLAVLGADRFRRIAVVVASMRGMGRPDNYTAGPLNAISRHCLASAVLAEELAAEFVPELQNAAYCAGLLHGVPYVCAYLKYKQSECEVSLPGNSFSFDELGERTLSEWRLPDVLVRAIFPLGRIPGESDNADRISDMAGLGCEMSRTLGFAAPFDHACHFRHRRTSDMIESGNLNGILKKAINRFSVSGIDFKS